MTDFAIGVVSQGIQVCSVIATYIGALKDRDEDLASIDRQAQGLESVFRTLRESLTQGSLDPSTSPAAAQVLSSMQTCEAELNSLKQLAARFSNSLSPDARPQDKIKQQVKKLRYPIQKPDIYRIQKSLGVVKETLDLALQNLELSYSCLATSKLSNLEAASQQVSSSLAALDSDITTLHTKLDDLLDRLQQNNTAGAAALYEANPRVAIYKLAYKPSNLAALCASLESTTNVLRTAPIAEASWCPCRRHIVHRTKRISWLPWDFWDDEILRFEHYKGCKYFRSNGDERSRTRRLRVTSLIRNAVIITLYTSTGAGGQSLGVNLEYRVTVDRMVSPAFRVISVLEECADMLCFPLMQGAQRTNGQTQWKKLAFSAGQKIEYLFRLGKASPKDVDSRNKSLLHASNIASDLILENKDIDEAYSLPIAHLVTLLVKRQVSASLLDLKGRLALTIATPGEPLFIPLVEAFYPYDADIHNPNPFPLAYDLEPKNLASIFSCYAAMQRVADAFFGPLSMAILSNDQVQIYRLLRKHPEFLQERAYRSDQTPFHLADESVIANASKHCKIHLAKSLLQRRQKLKLIAQQCLSPLEIDNFSLHRPVILDIYAMQIDEILRERGFIEFGPLATYVEDDIVHSSPIQDNRSIYHELYNVEDANIYFDFGFHDIKNGPGMPKRWRPRTTPSRISLPFVKWLLDHDAPLCEWIEPRLFPWTGYISDAFILAMLGSKWLLNGWELEDHEELVRELEERMLMDDSVDNCFCRCSLQGCTPFVTRLKNMRLISDDIATIFRTYLKEYGNALRRTHYYAAIRFITFDALGIAHTCMCKAKFYGIPQKMDAEEIAEIQGEYAELLELLESLIEEFETHAFETFDAATDGLDIMITFWNGYWVRRMNEVLSELSRAGEASNAAAEDLGVVWGPQTETQMYKKREWKGWDYYFRKIEEIE
ncbi:hypothetical protein T069G_00731 [Trichoderma breve]|uniref:Fungal N-terminal domain-containing protein n=1 Tax=Trichoderma breve TaxID=2034170 RepID=A0A9W9ECM1_9HYPO|nr:hypothetical protein T069G_00731 [Trichoderma breve]KAJ4864201.1 hypothetical protein T069G_00731 [Trichoderma breve]